MQALDDGEWSIRLEDREIHSSCFFSLGRRHCNVTEIQAVISEVILGRYLRFRENLKKKKIWDCCRAQLVLYIGGNGFSWGNRV